MQLLLDADSPVLMRLVRNQHTGDRAIEVHKQNDNGTLTMTALIVLGPELQRSDYVAVGQTVLAVLA